ncbi:glucosamine-6-phosphate deaminase [Lederbergia citrea]|uniref:Glucosamine-6-phosphate deaminase n=1 Tax=Lederbergia citrea TaxID=2833581 RepID=A0A942UPX6_9BACI|nr:glucosamine-6-phosphate deaminase [Lederbergia citrea]MBS4204755.1 glucosamine-6-phosphate deaminase [Lederbergia citrea]MBS4223397.1 glucosamine-6-phosphate deaminase [Lederbergia citrea]
MNVIVVKNDQEAAEKAFEILKSGLEQGEINTLGLATGGTPLKLYAEMRNANLDVSNVTTVNLDEYVGLSADNEQSYNYYMNQELFNSVKFKETNLPNGVAQDLEAECERYEKILEENPVDLQVLGLGTNAHIGFNEPGTPFDSKTHVVKLTESTIEANKRYFEKEEDVPTHAISMGIASIMEAKQIVLLAFGEAKAEAVKQMIEGPVTEECPASALQNHPNVTIIVDEAAASQLK